LGETTTTTDSETVVAGGTGTGGGGGGLTAGWIAVIVGLAVFALAGWTVLALKWAKGRRASAVLTGPAGEPVRFVLAERLAHWFYALCFLAAGLSGALMWIPSTRQWMAGARYEISKYHGYVGLAMVLVPLLIFFILDRKRLAEDRRALDEWTANDSRWLWTALSGGMLRGKKLPPQGRFNAGQKVNSHLVAGLAMGFVATGVVLLLRLHLPFWLTSGVLFAHQVLAVTGGVMLLGHLSIALFTRHGRGGLKAMVKGTLPPEIAREGHAIWYAEWLRQNRADDAGAHVADS
jgi:formate dehydrogenase subunit gamma